MKKVLLKNNNLILNVDGKDIAPIAYMSYLPFRADYATFRKIGYELFSVSICMGDKPINELSGIRPFEKPIWKARKEFDFSVVDRVVGQVLGDELKGYLLLRINVNMPSWWREENPDDLVRLSNGKVLMQSSFSEKWIADVKYFFAKLKTHIENTKYKDNIIAWQIAAMNTEEWIAPLDVDGEPDFSVCAQKAFSRWCEEKYKNIYALNIAWGTELIDFSEIEIPSIKRRMERNETAMVDVARHRQTIDYYRCFNESYANALECLCKAVKQIYANDIFVGVFYGYIGQLGCYSGHCALSKILHSENIDFFASPFGYTELRQTARDWIYHSAMQSCTDAGKLWFLEADVRTFQTKSLYDSMPSAVDKNNERMYAPIWFGPKTEEESIWNLVRSFGKVLTSGNAFWWFDMWGGWYNTPKMLEFMNEARRIYLSALKKPFKRATEVAVVLDEDASYGMNTLYYGQTYGEQLVCVGDAGVPYDLYLKGDFSFETLKQYKCVFYLAPLELTSKDIELIKRLDELGITVVLTGRDYNVNGEHIFIPNKALVEKEIREYYKSANVHIYLEKTGLIFANADFISITAAEDGEYMLSMPKECVLCGFFEQESYSTQHNMIKIAFRKNQSKLFAIKKSEKV